MKYYFKEFSVEVDILLAEVLIVALTLSHLRCGSLEHLQLQQAFRLSQINTHVVCSYASR